MLNEIILRKNHILLHAHTHTFMRQPADTNLFKYKYPHESTAYTAGQHTHKQNTQKHNAIASTAFSRKQTKSERKNEGKSVGQ